MKKLLVILVSVMITSIFLSNAEAVQQTSCGQVMVTTFRPASQSSAIYNGISVAGMSGQVPSTADREIGKIALVLRLNGLSACITYDLSFPNSFDNIIH